VAHLLLFGAEVSLEGLLRHDLGGDALGDGNACGLECGDLFGVIGDEANAGDAEELEDGGGHFISAAVGGVAELFVGLDGIAAVVLELVGTELGHEADAAALLLLIEEDAGAGFRDFLESKFELEPAVAAEGAEDVAGEALRVNADEGRGGVDIAKDEGNEAFDGGLGWRRVGVAGGWRGVPAFESQDAEVRPAGGKIGLGDFLNAFEWHIFILRCGASGASHGV
jgi:hypothetical protein